MALVKSTTAIGLAKFSFGWIISHKASTNVGSSKNCTQAQLTAEQNRRRTGAYEPYGRLTQFGNVLTGLGGGYAGQQYQDPGSGGSPFQTALGTATGLAGLYGKIFDK